MIRRAIFKHGPNRGFTLLELSIVLALIGVILGGGLSTFSAYLQSSQFNTTVAKMDTIEQALLNYAAVNRRIPCPSDLTLAKSDVNYGVEPGSGFPSSTTGAGTGVCSGGSITPASTFTATGGQVEGSIPTRALQLPDSYMYDGWGRRFSFAVDPAATVTGALPVQPGVAWCGNPITVQDAALATRSSNAIYAIISHGGNGHGSYTSNGVMFNANNSNANKLTNCHCTSAGVANASYTPTYVQAMPTLDTTGNNNTFDDIVAFKDAWQMQTRNSPLATQTAAGMEASMCIYEADFGNGWVDQFNSSGTYLGQIGCQSSAPAPSGEFLAPSFMTIDSKGYLWVTDASSGRMTQFATTPVGGGNANCFGTYGTYINRYGSWGAAPTTLGRFGNVNGVAQDAYGNIWMADNAGGRVQMWSATTQTWVGQVGCDGTDMCVPGTAVGCTATGVTCPCAAGGCPATAAADGQLSGGGSARGIAFDKNNNLWVLDGTNFRVMEYTINYNNITGGTGANKNMGTWVQTVGGGSGCAGGVNGASCITTNGNATCCTPGTACSCVTSTGMGNLSYSLSIAIDPDGTSLWVVDSYNDRLQKFAISGNTSTLIQEIGGAGTASCSSGPAAAYGCRVSSFNCTPCTSTSTCNCTPNSGNGQFNHVWGMAFDPQGNIWVTDENNNRMEEINPKTAGINASGGYINGATGSLGYLGSFGTAGSAAGQIGTPQGVVITR